MCVCVAYRTKWTRQTSVGYELLAEASNLAAVQNILQSSPYWAAYAPLLSNVDAVYGAPHRAALPPPQRPMLPPMLIQGLQQHVGQIPPPKLYDADR